jgi:tripartite-type tricarboxylate transporter receptor subunit TctC
VDALGHAVLASISESPRVQAVRQTLNAEDTPMLGAELKDAVVRSWGTYRRLSMELGLVPE